MRQLATIRVINKISNIEKADKIQVATMENLQWEVVVKRDEFAIGDKVIFIEIDSLVPEKPEFEFLRDSKFRIKTRKMRGQISQGIIFPLSILPPNIKVEEGLDITEALQIGNYVKSQEDADDSQVEVKSKSKVLKFFMGFAWFRFIYLKLNAVNKGDWPEWGQKSDENRIQVCARNLMEHFNEEWYITEKCDGQSCSVFLHETKKWGFKSWLFGVCSRNLWLRTPSESNYWKVAKQYDLPNKFKALKRETFLQGEICGSKVQKNKYKIEGLDMFVFTIVEDGKRVSLERMVELSNQLGLKTVPIIYESFIPSMALGNITDVSEVVKAMVKMSIGQSKIYDTKREGIVMRLKSNPNISIKIINPMFLLENEE